MQADIWVNNTFTSYQGTGHLLGMRQHFIRFAGCGVACPIRTQCDEQPALTRRHATQRSIDDLVAESMGAVGNGGWVHITGGEPTDQDAGLQGLVRELRRNGMYVHVQTSGVRRVPVQWDWITVSPKVKPPLQTFGQELVVIDDGSWSADDLRSVADATKFWIYYLCPLWGRSPELTSALAKAAGPDWNMTIQAHKHWGVR